MYNRYSKPPMKCKTKTKKTLVNAACSVSNNYKISYKSFINKLINPCPTSYNSLRLSSTSQKNIKKVFSAFHRNTGEYKIKFLTGIVDQELFSKASYVSNLFAA